MRQAFIVFAVAGVAVADQYWEQTPTGEDYGYFKGTYADHEGSYIEPHYREYVHEHSHHDKPQVHQPEHDDHPQEYHDSHPIQQPTFDHHAAAVYHEPLMKELLHAQTHYDNSEDENDWVTHHPYGGYGDHHSYGHHETPYHFSPVHGVETHTLTTDHHLEPYYHGSAVHVDDKHDADVGPKYQDYHHTAPMVEHEHAAYQDIPRESAHLTFKAPIVGETGHHDTQLHGTQAHDLPWGAAADHQMAYTEHGITAHDLPWGTEHHEAAYWQDVHHEPVHHEPKEVEHHAHAEYHDYSHFAPVDHQWEGDHGYPGYGHEGYGHEGYGHEGYYGHQGYYGHDGSWEHHAPEHAWEKHYGHADTHVVDEDHRVPDLHAHAGPHHFQRDEGYDHHTVPSHGDDRGMFAYDFEDHRFEADKHYHAYDDNQHELVHTYEWVKDHYDAHNPDDHTAHQPVHHDDPHYETPKSHGDEKGTHPVAAMHREAEIKHTPAVHTDAHVDPTHHTVPAHTVTHAVAPHHTAVTPEHHDAPHHEITQAKTEAKKDDIYLGHAGYYGHDAGHYGDLHGEYYTTHHADDIVGHHGDYAADAHHGDYYTTHHADDLLTHHGDVGSHYAADYYNTHHEEVPAHHGDLYAHYGEGQYYHGEAPHHYAYEDTIHETAHHEPQPLHHQTAVYHLLGSTAGGFLQ